MKKIALLILPMVLLLVSCGKDLDQCKNTISYTKATAIYDNLESLRATPLIESARQIENAGKIYVGEDVLLIGEEGKGIHVFDNRTKSSPSNTIFLNIPHNKEFFVEGTTIYAESHYDFVSIDISDVTAPRLTSRAENIILTDLTDANDRVLVGFTYEDVTETIDCDTEIIANDINFFDWNNNLIPASTVPSSFAGSSAGTIGTVNRIAVAGTSVFMVSNRDLYVFNDFNGLELLTAVRGFDWGMETVYHSDGQLFIGKTNGMSIVDISDVSAPQRIREYNHPESCDPVLPHETVAYVTLRSEGSCPGDLDVLDVVDLTGSGNNFSLNELQQIPMDSPYGMTISENFLFVGEGTNGLKMFDITDPQAPVLVATNREVEAYDVILHPTENIILIAGPNGLEQYEDNGSLDLSFLSSVSY